MKNVNKLIKLSIISTTTFIIPICFFQTSCSNKKTTDYLMSLYSDILSKEEKTIQPEECDIELQNNSDHISDLFLYYATCYFMINYENSFYRHILNNDIDLLFNVYSDTLLLHEDDGNFYLSGNYSATLRLEVNKDISPTTTVFGSSYGFKKGSVFEYVIDKNVDIDCGAYIDNNCPYLACEFYSQQGIISVCLTSNAYFNTVDDPT
jgi:hypothetical protein